MRIPPSLVRVLILRGIVLWFLARLMAIAVLSFARVSGGGALLPVWAMAVSASLVLLDLRRRRELMLLNNLGVATSLAVFIGSIPAILFEGARLVLVA